MLQTYYKLTYRGLFLNLKSFTSFSHKINLTKCLIDRSFKVCNNWNSFHSDIGNIKSILIKNACPPFLIDKNIKKYLDYMCSSNQNQLKTNLTFISLNYHTSAAFQTISKKNF